MRTFHLLVQAAAVASVVVSAVVVVVPTVQTAPVDVPGLRVGVYHGQAVSDWVAFHDVAHLPGVNFTLGPQIAAVTDLDHDGWTEHASAHVAWHSAWYLHKDSKQYVSVPRHCPLLDYEAHAVNCSEHVAGLVADGPTHYHAVVASSSAPNSWVLSEVDIHTCKPLLPHFDEPIFVFPIGAQPGHAMAIAHDDRLLFWQASNRTVVASSLRTGQTMWTLRLPAHQYLAGLAWDAPRARLLAFLASDNWSDDHHHHQQQYHHHPAYHGYTHLVQVALDGSGYTPLSQHVGPFFRGLRFFTLEPSHDVLAFGVAVGSSLYFPPTRLYLWDLARDRVFAEGNVEAAVDFAQFVNCPA